MVLLSKQPPETDSLGATLDASFHLTPLPPGLADHSCYLYVTSREGDWRIDKKPISGSSFERFVYLLHQHKISSRRNLSMRCFPYR